MSTITTASRTFRVTFRHADGDTFQMLVDGHDQGDALSFQTKSGAVAVYAAEVSGEDPYGEAAIRAWIAAGGRRPARRP